MPEPEAHEPNASPDRGTGGFVALKRRALARGIPLTVHLELTYACNWRCGFCYNPRRHDARPLSLDEWAAVFDELRSLGTLTIVLTGGEPLARPDFFEIAAAVRERSFALKLFTNGTLVTDEAARRIAALRPLAVELSLHGATAATHDRTTGRPGSFAALWRGVERLLDLGVPLSLKTPLSCVNEGELDAIIALASRRGLPLRIDPNMTPRDDADRSPLLFSASRRGVATLMTRLGERGELPSSQREPGGVNCGLGRLTMAIDPEGNVFPCIQWRGTSLGNVRRQRLREMWRTARAREEAAQVARRANEVMLGLGGEAAHFPFCPALAQLHTGDPLRPYPGFLGAAAAAGAVRRTHEG